MRWRTTIGALDYKNNRMECIVRCKTALPLELRGLVFYEIDGNKKHIGNIRTLILMRRNCYENFIYQSRTNY